MSDQPPSPPAAPPPDQPLTLRRRLALAYPFTTRLILLTYVLYGGFALGVNAYSNRTGQDISLCTFKRYTGHPCATCGGTRAAQRLVHFDLAGALEYNPFATALLIFVAAWLVISFVRAGRPLIRWTRRRRTIALSLALLALALNWVYVWNAEPRLTARDHAARDQAARAYQPAR